MSEKSESSALGQTVFYICLAATLVFFWWLLIYDHGVVSAH